ncbi:unnamed protein product [Protopolystoma xenopodis]|uniref:Uncharacterized protein n=1 Tax=Protopolystoma xenopodis TaxID=117903 RepID=A0A3S5CHF4_9PLAT|nr:unnamed protein product [Protopolystoma xenopodis]
MPAKCLLMYQVHGPTLEMMMHTMDSGLDCIEKTSSPVIRLRYLSKPLVFEQGMSAISETTGPSHGPGAGRPRLVFDSNNGPIGADNGQNFTSVSSRASVFGAVLTSVNKSACPLVSHPPVPNPSAVELPSSSDLQTGSRFF